MNTEIFNFNNLNTTHENSRQALNTKITMMKIENDDDKHHIVNKTFYDLINKIKTNIQKIIEIKKLHNDNIQIIIKFIQIKKFMKKNMI